jgi:hypothetical protein
MRPDPHIAFGEAVVRIVKWLYVSFQASFLVLSVARVGGIADWPWYEVLWPTWLFLGFLVLCLIPILLNLVITTVSERKRDPHHTFEPLRRFRAWRWEKTQQKYNSDKES